MLGVNQSRVVALRLACSWDVLLWPRSGSLLDCTHFLRLDCAHFLRLKGSHFWLKGAHWCGWGLLLRRLLCIKAPVSCGGLFLWSYWLFSFNRLRALPFAGEFSLADFSAGLCHFPCIDLVGSGPHKIFAISIQSLALNRPLWSS